MRKILYMIFLLFLFNSCDDNYGVIEMNFNCEPGDVCKACNGTGYQRCPTCGGKGGTLRYHEGYYHGGYYDGGYYVGEYASWNVCSQCKGKGTLNNIKCSCCSGYGIH